MKHCRNLAAYPDLLSALAAVVDLNRRLPAIVDSMYLYQCPACGLTHVGMYHLENEWPTPSPAALVDQQWSHYLMAPVRERELCNAR